MINCVEIQDRARDHVEVWKDRYIQKLSEGGRSAIITDLDCNYDWSCELEDIPEDWWDEYKQEFTLAVLEELGLEPSCDVKNSLKKAIDGTDGDIREKLINVYNSICYEEYRE